MLYVAIVHLLLPLFLFLILCHLPFRLCSQPYSVTTRPAKEYAAAQARASLEETWGARAEELLDSLTDDEAVSVGSLLNYVHFTQKGVFAWLSHVR